MSRRQREARDRSLRLRVAEAKTRRRRARLAAAGPVAVAATAAALTVAGAGATASASSGQNGSRQDNTAGVAGSAAAPRLAGCGAARTPSSDPSHLVRLGGHLFFTADDGVHGDELWRSTGTKSGTVMVKNINPTSPHDEYAYGPSDLTVVGDTLFFTADDGVHGIALWKSDGTRAGTVMVRDIDRTGEGDPYGPNRLTAVGDTLFFVAEDGVHGHELWKSDGTRAGTVMVRDINPDQSEYAGGPFALTAVGDTLFFNADDGEHGRELWKSDGSGAGTTLVKDITPADAGEYSYGGAYSLADVAGTLFFTADDGVHGRELWKSDGTEAGTTLVKDIRPGTYDSNAGAPVAVGDTLFFTARDGTHGRELWTSDGTGAGTVLVKDLNGDARASGVSYLTRVGSEVFFSGDDGAGPALWKSSGTEAGTTLVSTVAPTDGEYGGDMTGVGNLLYFVADDGTHGPELWRSNGTDAGTVLVRDITPGTGDDDYSYAPSDLTGVGSDLYFVADDSVHGGELWRSDGTEAGTRQVRDVNQGGGFTLPRGGAADTRTGELDLQVRVEGAGHLVAGPAGEQLIRTTREHPRKAGRTRVTLTPNAAGMRELRHALRVAHRHGKNVGKVRVGARFTFTPCGGGPSSQTRRYTLTLR